MYHCAHKEGVLDQKGNKLDSLSFLGSISSPFVSPRSLPHTTAGSLVYLLYFLTNHSQPCSNRAGFPVIGPSVTRLSNMADIDVHEVSSALKCVLERFHIEKFN